MDESLLLLTRTVDVLALEAPRVHSLMQRKGACQCARREFILYSHTKSTYTYSMEIPNGGGTTTATNRSSFRCIRFDANLMHFSSANIHRNEQEGQPNNSARRG